MSNFRALAIHPARLTVELADWLDNHFGPHVYGVRFDDGQIHPARFRVPVSKAVRAIDAAHTGMMTNVVPISAARPDAAT